ncbi:glycoside hydrolase family 43 protein [Vallitalea okinawensis]|uniref:glycoside hydrolase family 43 protein n=1 Tax=Vallitalea okinawensis TaxID=2078660 RepID=UPI000CFD2952|nr:glycoside hydrolase family 43 protein [Vallitalea okinawensis]
MDRTKVKNPVLKGFNPDPSILRVGDDYYIANSTFEYFPGVQIHHSKDLVNWELIARPLNTREHLNLIGNPRSGGIWAPCLSYDQGKFYLIFTDVKSLHLAPFKDCHNYITTAESITGPWSKPVYLNSSGFDPSLFHDGDKKWYLNMEWDHRKPPISPMFSGILLQEFDESTMSLVGEVKKIFTGTDRGLTEGPHIFKRGKYYYLVTAEGGTSYNHAVTIVRSQHIEGPYEEHPNKHLVTSMGRDDLVIQKAGHGSLVETKDGKWYLSFLCGRPLPGTKRCILGRETAIQEVEWIDDWPYLVNGSIFPDEYFYVDGDIEIKEAKEELYTFENEDFLKDFQTLRIPYSEDVFSIKDKEGFLRIKGLESPVSNFKQGLLLRRQEHFKFEAETKLVFHPSSFQHMAGLSYRYDETNQYYLYMSYDESTKMNVLKVFKMDQGHYSFIEEEEVYFNNDTAYLKVKTAFAKAQFYYSFDGESFNEIGPILDTSILSDDYTDPEGFTGAFIGMACQDIERQSAKAYFEYFKYTPELL